MVLATPPRCPEKEMHRILFAIACILSTTSALAGDKPYKEEDCGKLTVQMELNECAGTNYAAADKALNVLYRRTMALQKDSNARMRLRVSERDWMVRRDKSCADEVGSQEQGGSIWSMEMNTCLQEKADDRIRALERMVP
jgi:uncharacterized protein YecT (DUF1311 family)